MLDEATEINRLNLKIDELAKSVSAIRDMLNEQKGANLPVRLTLVENKIQEIELKQASREGINDDVASMKKKQEEQSAFMYKVMGGFVVLGVVMQVGIKLFLDYIMK